MDITTLAAANFEKWAQALLTKNPATVAALYAEHLMLLPTMARNVIHDRSGAKEYFTFFLGFHPTVQMVEEHVYATSEQSYVHCGVYRFAIDGADGREELDARFTLVWQKNDAGEWQILHHHSSRIPII